MGLKRGHVHWKYGSSVQCFLKGSERTDKLCSVVHYLLLTIPEMCSE